MFENEQLRIFLKNFSKKMLDERKEQVYNDLVPTREGRNKEKHKVSESVKENQGQRKKFKKVLDKVSEL